MPVIIIGLHLLMVNSWAGVMVLPRILAPYLGRKNGVQHRMMYMLDIAVAMLHLGVDMDPWHHEEP